MLLFLPPSEGKARPAAGAPVDLGSLAFAGELTAARERLAGALQALAKGPREAALAALGLSAAQAGELELDAALETAPAAPASEVYTGVLYERLGLPQLPSAARERARESMLIASALWGAVRPDDRIPAYRLAIGARLARLGPLAGYWRPQLRRALPEPGLLVDLRSGAYAAAWKPRSGTVLAVRAFAERADGSRSPISHMAKRVRGDVARALLLAPAPAASPDEVAHIAEAAGMRVELRDGSLDVIERAA